MTTDVQPYLFFSGKCEEALQHYTRCLGGKITALMRFEGSPMDNADLPAAAKQKVMHAKYEGDGLKFMASDNMMQPAPSAFSGFGMCISLEDEAKARRWFEALSQGGQVRMSLENTFWGALFGILVDKYGVQWMINCQKHG